MLGVAERTRLLRAARASPLLIKGGGGVPRARESRRPTAAASFPIEICQGQQRAESKRPSKERRKDGVTVEAVSEREVD